MILRSWNINDLEVQKTYLQSLYPLQLCCKAWPSMGAFNHGDQIFAIRPKALTC